MPPGWVRLLIGALFALVLLGVCERGPASCRDAQAALVAAMTAARDGDTFVAEALARVRERC